MVILGGAPIDYAARMSASIPDISAEFPGDPIPNRAAAWQLRTRRIEFGPLPVLMGIVNVTPDSFSDGGQFRDAGAAVSQAERLVADGADLIDVGGESTRPYSQPVPLQQELDRVLPVIERLYCRIAVPISIDTSKAAVARAAIELGAEIINDVTGLEGDPDMLTVARTSKAGICAMHMQGNPQNMQDQPAYDDVAREVGEYLARRRDALMAERIDRDRICLDPGIGFGKTHEHNLRLMRQCGQYHFLGCPLLVGHSRKGFLGKVLGDPAADRGHATTGAAIALARRGIQVIRLHEVRPTREALLAFAACGGLASN